jgi:uncharacterized membrane protein YtjA (UPF0391 family)
MQFGAMTRPQVEPEAEGTRNSQMLQAALGFFVVALIAAVLGFSGMVVAAAGIARILFFIFLLLFLISLAADLCRRA